MHEGLTDAFLEAVVSSHRMALEVEVASGDTTLATLTSVVAGGVTLDGRAAVRGRLDLTVVDDGSLGLVPRAPTDPLAPYGQEVHVRRGVRYPDGSTELAHLGVFRIESVRVVDELTIQITGQDRSARIIDGRYEQATQIAQGTNVATAILGQVQAVYPTVVYDFATTGHTTPQIIAEEGGDRWVLCQDLATSAGMRLYFDGDGILVLEPDAVGSSVATLAEGEGGVLLAAAKEWTRQGAFNRIIVTGENTGETTPVRGIATDSNPLSPTYFYGPFGQVPRFFQSQFIVTTAQANDAAASMLARELGTTQNVSFGSLVLPYLEPGEVVTITRERVGISEDHVIDSITIPLTADGQMTGETRATQVLV